MITIYNLNVIPIITYKIPEALIVYPFTWGIFESLIIPETFCFSDMCL